MTYGIWQFDERVAMIFLGSLMILGSYFYSRRIWWAFLKELKKREASLNTLTELLKQRGGSPGYTGETVNEASALSVSTVMACVSLLADSIAGLPLNLFREQAGRKIELSNTAFLDKPNINEMRFETIHQ